MADAVESEFSEVLDSTESDVSDLLDTLAATTQQDEEAALGAATLHAFVGDGVPGDAADVAAAGSEGDLGVDNAASELERASGGAGAAEPEQSGADGGVAGPQTASGASGAGPATQAIETGCASGQPGVTPGAVDSAERVPCALRKDAPDSAATAPDAPPAPVRTAVPAARFLDGSASPPPDAPVTPAAGTPQASPLHLADAAPISTVASAIPTDTGAAQDLASYPSAASMLCNTYAARMLRDASIISATMRGGTASMSSSTRRGRSKTRGRAGNETYEGALTLQAGSPRFTLQPPKMTVPEPILQPQRKGAYITSPPRQGAAPRCTRPQPFALGHSRQASPAAAPRAARPSSAPAARERRAHGAAEPEIFASTRTRAAAMRQSSAGPAVTRAQPFRLHSEARHEQYVTRRQKELAEDLTREARRREFHARPLSPKMRKAPCDTPGRAHTPTVVTEIKAFNFASEQRHQRYLTEVQPRREERSRRERRLAAQRAAAQKAQEAAEIQALRQRLDQNVRAKPLPDLSKPNFAINWDLVQPATKACPFRLRTEGRFGSEC